MEKRKTKNKVYKIIFVCASVIFLLAVAALVYIIVNSYISSNGYKKYTNSSSVSESSKVEVDNPIDFDSLKNVNTDIYAWIRIPDTNVDYPIVQSTDTDDGFYLNHDVERKSKFAGSIYSEKQNSKDFSDPNTVLYGHNMLNGSMFRTLHKFRDKAFFDSHKYIYVYTPGHILTYEVCAAYKYDNRHILNSFNFSDPNVFADYIEYVKNPKSMVKFTRDAGLNENSKLLTLSTCIGDKNYRFLVQGVLINDEPTK